MKICHVAINNIFLPPTEGGGVHEFQVAKNLAKLGHEVRLIVDRKKDEPKFELFDGVSIYRSNTYKIKRETLFFIKNKVMRNEVDSSESKTSIAKDGILLNLKRIGVKTLGLFLGIISLPSIIKVARDCDVIYERSSSFGAGTFVAILLRKPLVIEVVDIQRLGFLLLFVDKIMTHSYKLIPSYIDRKKIIVITNAVDTKKFNPNVDGTTIRKKYNIGQSFVVTYMGGFHPWHGLEETVDAAEKIIKKFPNTRFLMIGAGPMRKNVAEKIHDKKIENWFIFIDKIHHTDIPEFLAVADVTLAIYTDPTYQYYNSTTKIQEYMALGKPVIAYGIKEGFIKNGVNGFLINPNDSVPEKIVEYAIMLLEDETLRRKMGQNASDSVILSWEDYAKQVENTFESIIDSC